MIGGVGQRVLSGVAKKTAGEFFAAVDDVLTGKAASVPAPREEPVHVDGLPSPPTVYTAPAAATGASPLSSDFVKGAVFGAVVALLGALIGALGARRRTP